MKTSSANTAEKDHLRRKNPGVFHSDVKQSFAFSQGKNPNNKQL